MAHVQATDVSLAFGDRDILSHVTLALSSGDRCALAGANGSGKSTLMKILAGIREPDSGTVTMSRDATTVYLPQSGIDHHGRTLLEEIELSYEQVRALVQVQKELEHRLSETTDSDSELESLLDEHHQVHEQIVHSGYYEREAEIDRILTGLGFKRTDFDRKTEEFSGGWQMRIALAKALLRHPDMLLLDEPTNYLDVEARVWLGSFLSSYSGGVLLVSHDRRFLDQTVNHVWELFLGNVKRYHGIYTAYERQREQEIEQIVAAYEQQQDEIRRIEDFIRRFRAKATKAKQVQSRVKQLEKMERIEIPEHLRRMTLTFPPAPRSGEEVLRCHSLSRSYGQQVVLEDVNLTVTRGERVVLVGPNGAGKSTLMRILAERDTEYSGAVTPGANVRGGFYADDDNWLQQNASAADGSGPSVLSAIESVATQQTDQQLRNLLGAFLFMGDDIYKPVDVLSGGERSRLAMLQLLLQPYNLLILDEPTNHLDLSSKDVLLAALRRFSGTIVFVSHDREFVEQLATRVIELRPGGVRPQDASLVTDFPGDYSYYAWRLERREEDDPEVSQTSVPQTTVAASHEEQKARRSRIQKLERLCERLMHDISELEAEQSRLQDELALPEIYSDGEAVRERTWRIEQLEQRVLTLTEEWEGHSEELHDLTGAV